MKFILFTFLLSLNALADQNEVLLQSYTPHSKGGAYSSAVHGILRQVRMNTGISRLLTKRWVPVDGGKFHIKIRTNKNLLPNAPLAILVNPLFSTFPMRQMMRPIDHFISKGYNVIEFQNTWTKKLAKNGDYPFFPGDIWNESRYQLEVVKAYADSELGGLKSVPSVILVGASYGSFLAAIMKAFDEESGKPFINGPTVLLSPPHDIFKSMENLDHQNAEVLAANFRRCHFPAPFFKLLTRSILLEDYHAKEIDDFCAKAFLVHTGFFGQLKGMVKKLNKTRSLGLSKKEIRNITFASYVKGVAGLVPGQTFPEAETNIGHWLKRSRDLGYDKFQIISTEDDNINEGLLLKENSYYDFSRPNTIVLPTGGHLGFEGVLAKEGQGAEFFYWIDRFWSLFTR